MRADLRDAPVSGIRKRSSHGPIGHAQSEVFRLAPCWSMDGPFHRLGAGFQVHRGWRSAVTYVWGTTVPAAPTLTIGRGLPWQDRIKKDAPVVVGT